MAIKIQKKKLYTVLKVYLSPQYLPCVRFIVLCVCHWQTLNPILS